ncbi:hypothetical protein [Massilia sp. YIM B04103]|uniref:hypothetical protein n=1 Tax=Massilia sp. YIM B04103 TaxID=2963106 RepID=UPI00210BE825|nr:hypothetical protein [Massilia sp. YIM B04103]
MNIQKILYPLLFTLFLHPPAVASELDVKRLNNSAVTVCNREINQCSTVSLPPSAGAVRQLLQGKFITHAQISWITISRKKAHVCALQKEGDSLAVCVQVATDVSKIKIETSPHISGGIRWVFTPRTADVATEEVGYKFIMALEKANAYFAGLSKSGGASHRSLMRLSASSVCLPKDDGDNADTACAGDDDEDNRDDDNDRSDNDNESGEGQGGMEPPIALPLPPGLPPVIITRPPSPPKPQDPDIPPDRLTPSQPNPCSLFGIGCPIPKDPPRPAAECQSVYRGCQQSCAKIYADNPDWLPGSGSDYASRMRVCIRDCMRSGGCENY